MKLTTLIYKSIFMKMTVSNFLIKFRLLGKAVTNHNFVKNTLCFISRLICILYLSLASSSFAAKKITIKLVSNNNSFKVEIFPVLKDLKYNYKITNGYLVIDFNQAIEPQI